MPAAAPAWLVTPIVQLAEAQQSAARPRRRRTPPARAPPPAPLRALLGAARNGLPADGWEGLLRAPWSSGISRRLLFSRNTPGLREVVGPREEDLRANRDVVASERA